MKKVYFIVFVILVLLAGYSLTKIFIWNKENRETVTIVNELKEVVDVEVFEDKEVKKIDFNKLLKRNKDTVGWISVLGTKIDYPFVKSSNNKYYLTHSFDKKYTDAGWVFMDYRNSIDLNNKNTIIYGHARKDKSMFGTLKYTLKSSWYKKSDNHYIKVYLPNEELTYRVFSTYHVKTEDYYIKTDFSSDKEFSNFINKLKKRSIYNYNVDLNDTDSILTLSSCYNEKEKVVLHAKLVERISE